MARTRSAGRAGSTATRSITPAVIKGNGGPRPAPRMVGAVPRGVSLAFLRPLSEQLSRLDEDAAAFLAALGVEPEMAPETFVPGDRVDRELAAIAERRGDPAFALTLARAAAVRPLGLFGHMVWLSGTVRDALQRAARFYGAVSGRTRLTLEESVEGVATLRQNVVGAARGRILTEFPFASLALRAREATGGQFTLLAVRFRHAGKATASYAEVFGAPVTFEAPADEVELAVSQLELPLASADPLTSAVLEARIERLTESAHGRGPISERARRAAASLGPEVSLALVARSLGTSARSLRRSLEREGQSLRALVDGLRRERADELLGRGESVKEVAFALGFSEPSAFSRAYKRWTGRAPHTPRDSSPVR